MSLKSTQGGDGVPNARELLDAYFDGEIDRASKGQLHESLRHDPVLAEEFARTSEAVSMLRQSGSNAGLGVDLTESVLARCEAKHHYLSKRGRRFVLAGRSAVALAAMVMIAGVVVFIRLTPPGLRLPEGERPLGVLMESGNAEASGLRVVPPSVQKDLADSIDQSKVERTIVFDLPADSAGDFSPFRQAPAPASDTRAMARLPIFPGWDGRLTSPDWLAGPLPMDAQRAASVVGVPGADPMNWWARPLPETAGEKALAPLMGPPGASLLLRPIEPRPDAQRDRE
jgi:hypothetical protein